MTKLNKAAYLDLLAGDLEWLLKQPRTLERDHVHQVLQTESRTLAIYDTDNDWDGRDARNIELRDDSEYDVLNVDHVRDRARQMAEQIKKTWNPPIEGPSTDADIQTCAMITIAWLHGVEVLGDLTIDQGLVIHQGIEAYERAFNGQKETETQN